ncbi:MAG: hypothetical protein GX879_04190 [Bacteroidales bacterium]|nr:hypothetical protein [Bacteroidales bacterium]
MGFSFFRVQRHNVFNYKPRFYDAEKEEREKRRRQLWAEDGKDIPAEGAPGSTIKGSFNYLIDRRKSQQRASRIRTLIILFFLIFLAYIILAVDFTKFINLFNK